VHKPFKEPLAWVRFLGLPGDSAELVDTDIATTAQADRLIRVTGEAIAPYLLHIEFQASPEVGKIDDAHYYHLTAKRKYKLRVKTVFVLLRNEADHPAFSGWHEDDDTIFKYRVIRIWEHAPDVFLNGPISMLPLAVIARADREQMPEIIARARKRIGEADASVDESTLWLEMMLLLGLKYESTFINALLKGVRNMKESSTYQTILEEGKAEGKEEMLELLLQQRFSTLPTDITTRLDNLTADQMNDLAIALLSLTSLTDLERWLAEHA
jgi:predicted transposase YdaD